METFALYLIKSSVWLTGFSLIYFLFLRNERFFVLNRIYLVCGILVSIIFPLFTWHYTVIFPASPTVDILEPQVQGVAAVVSEPLRIQDLLLYIYLTGAIYLIFRLIKQTISVLQVIRRSGTLHFNSVKLVRTDRYPASFSFFSFVFVNPSIDETETNEIVNHEQEHIRQQHWIDLLLFEILCTLQWFNPASWLYGHFIRQNHEYLADERALQRTSNPAIYRAALLNQMFGGPVIQLANSFHYSINKKRFNMMKQTINSPIRKFKLLLVLPLIAGVFYAFATPEYKFVTAEKSTTQITEKIVTGKVVKDDGTPLRGTSIVVHGSTLGTMPDESGNFKLEVPDDSPLVFSFVGFKSVKITPDFEKPMVIKMVAENIGIDKVTVVGYGNAPPPPPPPWDPKNPPLFILDGVIIEKSKMDQIKPDDIESISILKDKSATDLYGEKAKNGVVLVTSKKIGIKIRSTDGNTTKPLYIVEGFEKPESLAKNINPDDIESINVLKGENAINKYGDKGKNGVVEIKLKTSPPPSPSGSVSTLKNNKEKEVFIVVEEMPEFPGGVKALRQYLASVVKYPVDAQVKGIQGQVFVKFVVTKTGKIADAKIARGIDPSLDKEAIRVVESLPDWKPGKQRGENVDVSYTIPIAFVLQSAAINTVKTTGTKESADNVFVVVEEMPEYPGGVNALRAFLQSAIKYPVTALENEIQGKVYVNFVVTKTGSIAKAKVVRGIDPSLDKEAIRVVESLPDWKPGKQRGQSVDVYYTVPVDFTFPADYHPKMRENLRTKSADVSSETQKEIRPAADQTAQTNNLIIVPNPTKDKATITLQGSGSVNKLEVSVFDSKGTFIRKESKNGPSFMLSFAGFTSGTYLIVAKDGTTQYTGHLVVNH
jgi:TonB family protein